MRFQKFCDDLNDDQKIKTKETFFLTYSNRKGEEFSILSDSIKSFLEFLLENYEQVENRWSKIKSRKDTINKYEEESYKEIFNSATSDELKTISSAGRSQTKALTNLISKLIAFLAGSEYKKLEDETFFTIKHISSALNNWTNLFNEKKAITTNQNVSFLKTKFYNWMINNGLSERTAKSYSVTGINFCDTFIKQINSREKSFYLLSPQEILIHLNSLKKIPDWLNKNNIGNSMYSASCKMLAKFLFAQRNTIYLPKPFLLLAGISGTGKSRFVREQAKASGSFDETYCLTSVRPDWHEPSDLLGYISRLNDSPEYVATDVLRFIVKAWKEIIQSIEFDATKKPKNWKGKQLKDIRPYWLCLDEMNLAPVEQYFSDYLSVLETRSWNDPEKLKQLRFEYVYECDPLIKGDVFRTLDIGITEGETKPSERLAKDLNLDLSISLEFDIWQYFLKHGISIPFNLIVAGTVNMDETTHGFSRKVIDRALSFDFGEFYPNNFADYFTPSTINKTLSFPIFSDVKQDDLPIGDANGQKSIAFLNAINTALDNTPFKLAFRALNELLLSVVCMKPQNDLELQAVWDDFLMCKVLPRIEGDCDKLASHESEISLLDQLHTLLETQFSTCWNEPKDAPNARPDFYREHTTSTDNPIRIACRSKAKIKWMQQRLTNSGFTSFWP